MKGKIFILFYLIIAGISQSLFAQINTSTGVSWGELNPGEPILLDESFQGFNFFHSDENTDMGNSNNSFDTDGTTIIYGYKNDSVEVPILGSTSGKIKYIFKQCAFAPEWKTAWSFRDEVNNTANVSNGFVEVSRIYSSNPPTIHGEFIVDLRQIEFVEVVQWTHSSSGGNKRGVMLEFSVDDGTTWDTLRYQPGLTWGLSFTKDITTRTKTSNSYSCDPSAYGMTWEEGIWAENIMLRFGEAGGQVPRIHDLKVYGTFTPPTSTTEINAKDINIYHFNRKIKISEPAKVAVYSITGKLVRMEEKSNLISMDDVPAGIYLVKASVEDRVKISKIIVQ